MNSKILGFRWLLVFISLILVSSCNQSNEQKNKPNIIFILADDYGYMDTQAYAQHILGTDTSEMFYETPNIDKLINEGVAFSQGYANQLCSPTRASLLTGKYAARLGFTTATPVRDTYYNQNIDIPKGSYAHDVIDHHDNIKIEQALINGSCNTALPAGTLVDNGWNETTIAEALPDYNSAFIGKWHVGGHGAEGYTPLDQGFNSAIWFDAGGSRYFNWKDSWNNRSKNHFPNLPQDEWLMGDAGEANKELYLTDALTEEALKYIDKRAKIKDEPFFLYLCHFAVHGPYQAKQTDSLHFSQKSTKGWNDHDDPTYAAMIKSLDNSVGKILDKLEEIGIEENTLVVFMSDNGGIDKTVTPNGKITSNFPLKGGKACLTEGGVRVPLAFRWKSEIDGGKWSDVVVDCNDIFPTLVEAAGYDISKYYKKKDGIDGQSLLGVLSDVENKNRSYSRNTQFWHYPYNVIYNNVDDGLPLTPHSAVRNGDYKLIFDWYGRLRLYNIAKDISEKENLAKIMPDKTNQLFAMLINWLDENVNDTYLPKENPDYNFRNESRDVPYINLVEIFRNGGNVAENSN